MKLSDNARASLDRVIERFKSGDLSAITNMARFEIPEDAPCFKWSFSNKVLAYIQSGELDCRGFNQWQDAGRKVKKGSKAVFILRPRTMKFEKEGEEPQIICVGFAPIPVFAASGTEGEGTLAVYQPRELPPLYDVAQRLGVEVQYMPVSPDKLGSCKPDGTRITIGTEAPEVFFHELAHAIHAKIQGTLKSGQDTTQETIAEFTSSVLMDLYGLKDTSGNTWQYIKMYANDPLEAITKAMATVEKVLQVLLAPENTEATV
jgi:hypothetical protein